MMTTHTGPEVFRTASALDGEAEVLVDQCLGRMGQIPASANLGFLYATDGLAGSFPALAARLRRKTPGIHWVGTVGRGICISGREIYDRPALALMLGAVPTGGFRILTRFRGGFGALPAETRTWWEEQGYGFAILHGDPSDPQTVETLGGLGRQRDRCFINGGLTSSESSHPQLAGVVSEGGLSGVLFDDQIEILTDHTQGCSPIGPVHRITKADKNIAFTLDHRPALDVMKNDIGEVLSKDLARVGGYIFAALPIPGSDTGDYLVRNLVGIDQQRGLVAVGDFLDDQGGMMFCRRDGNTARIDLERMLGRLARRIQGRSLRGGIYVSCLGRGRYQFGENSEELRLIQQHLGDFPLIGFFANGEIYNGRLYGYTGVLTLFV